MKTYHKINYTKFLYIFFVILSLNIFFFSTVKSEGKAFQIDNIEISRPFKINFNKNDVIDEGFRKAYSELISLIVKSSDQKKIKKIQLNEIKGMIESFTIKEEKFIDETYSVNLGVIFNKKKIFNYLENKNVFPSIPKKKTFLFIPIIIDESEKDLLIFYNNQIFDEWNKNQKKSHLLNYILPTEDLEELNLLKSKFENIEKYDFKEITKKYDLKDFIIALIFKNQNELRILSKINLNENTVIRNQTYENINFKNKEKLDQLIEDLKLIYEDYWKKENLINTSIKLILNVKANNLENDKISAFEKILNETDLIYDFFISKFDKNYTYYQIIFNGTPNVFLQNMSDKNYNFDTQNSIWILK